MLMIVLYKIGNTRDQHRLMFNNPRHSLLKMTCYFELKMCPLDDSRIISSSSAKIWFLRFYVVSTSVARAMVFVISLRTIGIYG